MFYQLEICVKKILFRLIMSILVLQTFTVYADDNMFNKMEAKGTFDIIRENFVASCYIKDRALLKTKIDLEAIKTQHPDRVKACTCFQKELSKVSNGTIFDDSRRAYQLHMEKQQALKNNDVAKLNELTEKEKSYKPFLDVIINKCALKQL